MPLQSRVKQGSKTRAFAPGIAVLAALAMLCLSANAGAKEVQACPTTKAGAGINADIRPGTTEGTLFPIGQILTGAELYCSRQSEKSGVVTRYHERLEADGQTIRLDHYVDGIGMGWGEKGKGDHPVYNSLSKSYSQQSFVCHGKKYGAASPTEVNCTLYPALVDGDVMPVTLTMRVRPRGSGTAVTIGAEINVRAFHSGEYVAPDRSQSITLTVGDKTEYLAFVGGVSGISITMFGGSNKLEERSSETLLKYLVEPTPVTLAYTDYEGNAVQYSFTAADHAHARASLSYLDQLVKAVYQRTELKFREQAAKTQ